MFAPRKQQLSLRLSCDKGVTSRTSSFRSRACRCSPRISSAWARPMRSASCLKLHDQRCLPQSSAIVNRPRPLLPCRCQRRLAVPARISLSVFQPVRSQVRNRPKPLPPTFAGLSDTENFSRAQPSKRVADFGPASPNIAPCGNAGHDEPKGFHCAPRRFYEIMSQRQIIKPAPTNSPTDTGRIQNRAPLPGKRGVHHRDIALRRFGRGGISAASFPGVMAVRGKT